jgi:TldD protein
VKDRLLDALARSRAGYGELRVRQVWSSTILAADRAVAAAGERIQLGGLARCCSPGTGWGATGFDQAAHFDAHLLRAHELSLAGRSRSPVRLAPIPIRQFDAGATLADDPRAVSLAAKCERVEQLAARLLDSDRRIESGRLMARDEVVETWFATSEGTWIHEVRARLELTVLARARQLGAVERALGSYSTTGWGAAGGFEAILDATRERAVERLEAVPIRAGTYPVVLDPSAMGALIHRGVTHLARPALPGADPDVLPLGARLGPEVLTLGDDPTVPGLAATALYDDEGTEARRTVVVQNGVLLAHLHSRESAGAADAAPTGHARSGVLQGTPFPRATNSFVSPGQGSLEDLLEGIPLGVYLADATACDFSEAGFLFRPGAARMIRNGHLAEPVKGVRLAGELVEILARVEAVGGDFRWDPGVSRCRDGVGGAVPVGTGSPHVRFLELPVGSELT